MTINVKEGKKEKEEKKIESHNPALIRNSKGDLVYLGLKDFKVLPNPAYHDRTQPFLSDSFFFSHSFNFSRTHLYYGVRYYVLRESITKPWPQTINHLTIGDISAFLTFEILFPHFPHFPL